MINPNNISFKDTAARVVIKKSGYHRYIFYNYKLEYDHLMNSGLYKELIEKGLLIEHEEIEIDTTEPKVYKLLFPTQILLQSYPFEWSYEQWKKAVLAYLKINLVALKYGMILKDATPYNFYLKGGEAIMFDTSSFIFFKGNDIWVAYRQFCMEFLSPVALMHYNGVEWSKLTMSHLNGMELNFVSRQLPLSSWFNLTILLNIHLHSKYTNSLKISKKYVSKGFTFDNLVTLHKMFYKTILQWEQSSGVSNNWAFYYKDNVESPQYLKQKEYIIRDFLKRVDPNTVLDLGANTGMFSFIASEYSEKVIAIESDYQCVDLIEARIKKESNYKVYCLNSSITEFSNGLGLNGMEVKKLSDRIESDVVLALALVHHLHISCYLSFFQIAEQLSNFSKRYALVEFIPKTDQKITVLLNSKNKTLDNYNEDEFEKAFNLKFKILDKKNIIGSKRKIYLFEKI
jgi:hypothetical protein